MDDLSSGGPQPNHPSFSRIGEMVANVSERTSDKTTLPNARRRFLSGTAASDSPPRALPRALSKAGVRRVGFAGAVLATACAVFIFLLAWRRERAISFTVGDGAEQGAVGLWVAPLASAPMDVRFSEGTVVTVTPGGRMRVTDTNAGGATLLIERGAIHAAIVHRSTDTRWSLHAGPFHVRVTGTSFDARWDPVTETFELTMLEGSVVVTGPRLPSERAVVAGEQLVVSASHMELRSTAKAAPPPASADAPASSAEPQPGGSEAAPAGTAKLNTPPGAASNTPSDTAGVASSEKGARTAGEAPSVSWRALARAGKHKEAMDAAEAVGFSGEVTRANASDLLALADTARFAGRPARAKEALMAMRKRFSARGSTAFLLGKISADQLRSPGEAAMWFETYLQEEPGGPLAEQALGRLMEIRKRDAGAARLVAQRYLARYPTGAYAALARSLVDK